MTHGTIAELDPESAALTSAALAPKAAPGGTLFTQFQAAAARFADQPALRFQGESVSYAEFAAQAARVAAGLQQQGIGPGSLVAILLERGPGMLVAMLGILQAGAAYLPLDVRYPAARIAETLADAEARAVIVTEPVRTAVPSIPLPSLLASDGRFTAVPQERDAPAYVIYTSGSTGRPKGVVVTHANVTRLFKAAAPWFEFTDSDVWTLFHSFAFDFSVWEIWGALLHGACLVIVPYETSRSPQDFRALLVEQRVTMLSQTPSAFALLDAADAEATSGSLALRTIVFGGEALSGSQLAPWMRRHGDAAPELINMYGITETTVHVTYRRMRLADATERDNLIGQSIPDLELHLLDEQLEPVPQGVEGELCVAGAGVAAGYLKRPELTAERFLPNPFGPGRLYKSGDRARRRADGELVYLGRHDGQVKINGFRIETGEVEAALLAHPAIAQACVVARPGPDGAPRLTAYYRASEELAPREFLAGRLPSHMLPSLYRRVAEFALNLNGKIDCTALQEAGLRPSSTPLKTTSEQRVASVWKQVLQLEAVGPEENFFDTGGTSLLLIAMRAGLEREFARAIPVTWMFECTTVSAMAARLQDDTRAVLSSALSSAIQTNAQKQRQAFARARAQRTAVPGGAR